MSRMTRHQMWMKVADVFAQRSTCMRLNVGAVIVDPATKRLLSHGYNGPGPKDEHCSGRYCADPVDGCHKAVHAEINALQRLSPFDINKAAVMYVTDSPCPACLAKILATRTIIGLFYRNAYRVPMTLPATGIEKLPIYRLTPSGFVIDHRTGELVDEDISV